MAHNPHQTPTRLALAALIGPQSPQDALAVLSGNNMTREMLVARTALLARLGYYGEAERSLAECDSTVPVASEPARYTWARGIEQSRQQQFALRTALAEQCGNWSTADKWRSITCVSEKAKSLQIARRVFATAQELAGLLPHQAWQRSLLEHRQSQDRHQIEGIPLTGEGLFFRALSCLALSPERAVRDLERLLHHRAWLERERKVGAGRLVFVGDALLRQGQARSAIHAYQQAGSPLPAVKERLAVALIYAEIQRQTAAEDTLAAVEHAVELAPNSPWVRLLAALGLLIAGERETVLSHLDGAKQILDQNPDLKEASLLKSVFGCLHSLATEQPICGQGLDALSLPEMTEAIIRLLCSPDPVQPRIQTFLDRLGPDWLTGCPTEPSLIGKLWLADLCQKDRWDEALAFADEFASTGIPSAKDLMGLVHLRHALRRALQGQLDEAECELKTLTILFKE